MRKEFKYYQTAHPSLLLETNKMNAVDDNESESEREKTSNFRKEILFELKLHIYFFFMF
jgi:hypothetical protein